MPPSDHRSLKQVANANNSQNPSQLGDPISLKAETSNSEPTKHDRPSKEGRGKSLRQVAEDGMKENRTQLGDPVSLKAETSDNEPTDEDRGASETSRTKNKGSKL